MRTRWTDHHSRTQPAIHRRDWIGADIDWTSPSGRIVKADKNGMMGVDFSEEDLIGWAMTVRPAGVQAARPGIPTTGQVKAESACGEYIKELPKTPRPRKEELEKLARAKFHGLSGKAFNRQWASFAPAEWKLQGAPKKTPQQ